MSKKPYHHGDLRSVMIEKGIELIDKDGAKGLSLRKLAAACGVSHSAPYSHFANKEELFAAITTHITDKFAAVLKESAKEAGETPKGLHDMGCAYVLFFVRNPEYFRFIFQHSDIIVGDDHPYEPYDFFKSFIYKVFDRINYPPEQRRKIAIMQWAVIHGLASIAIMGGRKNIPMWEQSVSDMLSGGVFDNSIAPPFR